MRDIQKGWRFGSLAVLLTLAGTCVRAHAQDHEDHTSLRERAQLFGDWPGARTRLAQRGIIVDIQATQFYQGVVDGSVGTDDWQYGVKGDNVRFWHLADI